MSHKFEEAEARELERSYLSREIVQQRIKTLEALAPKRGEQILDIGCGPGLLTYDIAQAVGKSGRVAGVDISDDVLALARKRCMDFSNVALDKQDVVQLNYVDHKFDAVVCTQVLLYVGDVMRALSEMHRVIKPGGRIVIIETDWRGCVLNSSNFQLTEQIIHAWDCSVPSPNLPVRLSSMLSDQEFSGIHIQAVPILTTNAAPGGYSSNMAQWFARAAVNQKVVTEEQARNWLEDLNEKYRRDQYFFCVNRFLFSAVKV